MAGQKHNESETPMTNQTRSGYDTSGQGSTKPPPKKRSMANVAQTAATLNVGLTLLVIVSSILSFIGRN